MFLGDTVYSRCTERSVRWVYFILKLAHAFYTKSPQTHGKRGEKRGGRETTYYEIFVAAVNQSYLSAAICVCNLPL